MAQQNTRKCPQCGTVARQKQTYCGGCGQRLTVCSICNTINLASSEFCHSCGKSIKARGLASEESGVSLPSVGVESRQVMQPGKPGPAISVRMLETTESSDMDGRVLKYLEDHHGGISIRRTSNDLNVTTEHLIDSLTRLQKKGLIQKEETTFVERMHNCHTCNKTIGADEPYCRYCGAKQAMIEELEPQAILDPRTMKVALTMLNRVVEAKDHPEYSVVDELTTTIGAVALGGEKPQDAQELSFQDQLRLLTLVFEYSRDKVIYKGESFGEYVRWPWETMKTGGDCDCKVVLLASMLASLAFRRMHFLILPPGTYVDTTKHEKRKLPGHALLEVELTDGGKRIPLRLDPSCVDCDVDDISRSMKPFLSSFYRIPIIP
ncbi:MAG: zinc ribbon domain-containing protein [Candidatus Bathyarchaeia archaeon]